MEKSLFPNKGQLANFLVSLGEQVRAGDNLNLTTEEWKLPFKFREPVKLEIDFEGYGDKDYGDKDYGDKGLEIEFKFKAKREDKAPHIS